jgi:Oxidoreductase molybdopterin binding domain.
MNVRCRLIAGIVLFFSLGLAAYTQQPATPGQQAPMGDMSGMHMGTAPMKPVLPASPLRISFGEKSAEWTPEAFAALPHTTVKVRNTHTKSDETYSGIALIDLLAKIGVPAKPHGKDLALYLIAEGADGYVAAYSVAEVNPDVHDATVIVADAVEGKPLTTDGPFKLVATGETRPARWVRNLAAVRVMAAQ